MKDLKTKYGLPLANADNVLKIIQSSGIANWKTTTDPIAVGDYSEADLTDQEIEIKRRFQIKVSNFLNPSGEVFRGFRFDCGHGTRVFTLLNGELVPICAEFQHGCGEVLFDLPGGTLESGEDPTDCARREFEEESGIILESIISLSSVGMPIAARPFSSRNFSFIGIASDPAVLRPQKLDAEEYLKVILISLDDWLKLIDREIVQAYSASTTLLALRRLRSMGLLKRNYV